MSAPQAVANKVVLIVIDGWGEREGVEGNAIHYAETPTFDGFKSDPSTLYTTLDASGLSVGIPARVMGNSEVGHLTIGAGRVSFQDLVLINKNIAEDKFRSNERLVAAFERAKGGTGRVHLLGLVSDGGVHSHMDHLKELLRAAKEAQVPDTFVHYFADGRDTPPTSGTKYMTELLDFMREDVGYGALGTVTGRYYAMDRDKRWERIQLAYEALVGGKGEEASPESLIEVVERRYSEGQNDEFLKPIIVNKESTIRDGDTLIFFDFRADRMRQIVETLGLEPPFDVGGDTGLPELPKDLQVNQMTEYNTKFAEAGLPVLFPPVQMDDGLAEWISKQGLRQYHTAETEKYAHVTFFFNGGTEKAMELEDRELVPSPKCATYDLEPEMNMAGVREKVVAAVEKGEYPFILCNMAAPDMVGHTGVYDAAVVAANACDREIGAISQACKEHGYVLVVTADHGNCEEMLDESGKNPKTSHTTNRVPLVIAHAPESIKFKYEDAGASLIDEDGFGGLGLSSVAPSILEILGLPPSPAMTGESLLA